MFADLPATAFPLLIEGIDADSDEVIWTRTVPTPGGVDIPGKPEGVRRVRVRVSFGDGEIVELG